MKRIFTLLFPSILFYYCGYSQNYSFQKLYGLGADYESTDILSLSGGGYIMCGNRTDPPNSLFLGIVARLDVQGNVLWSKNYSDGGRQRFYAIDSTSDGGFVLGGTYYPNVNNPSPYYKAFIVKTDGAGNLQWAKVIAAPYKAEIFSIKQTYDGGYIAGGMADDSISGPKMMMMKMDGAGNLVWANRYGTTLWGKEYGWDVQQTNDSCFIAVGNTSTLGAGSEDIYVVKANTNGNLMWAHAYGGAFSDGGNAILKANTGNDLFVLGASKSFQTSGNYDCYLLKIDQGGNLLWSKIYSTPGQNLAGQSLFQGSNGNLFLFGQSIAGMNGPRNYQLITTDSLGAVISAKQYDLSIIDYLYKGRKASDGGMILAGRAQGLAQQIYIVKTDGSGNSGCHQLNVTVSDSVPPTLVDSGGMAFSFGVETAPPILKIDLTLPDSVICLTVGINELQGSSPSFLIFPNPGNGNFTMRSEEVAVVEVYDARGRLCATFLFDPGEHQIRLPVVQGIYFLRSVSRSGMHTMKIVVE